MMVVQIVVTLNPDSSQITERILSWGNQSDLDSESDFFTYLLEVLPYTNYIHSLCLSFHGLK